MKTVLTLIAATLACGAIAQASPEIECGSFDASSETSTAKYDLRPGLYFKPAGENTFKCDYYEVRNPTHYSCTGNIKSFTFNCIREVDSFSLTMNCEYGKCVAENSDVPRNITISEGNDRQVYYESNKSAIYLTYDRPCRD